MGKGEKNMFHKKVSFIVLLLPMVLCISCLYSRTSSRGFSIKSSLKINSGKAIIKIYGQVNENLYFTSIFDNQIKDENYYNKPMIREYTITKNEIINLSTGEEYNFSVLPTEVVTINVISLDGNDVEIFSNNNGKTKKYILKGTNKLGLTIAFQNR
jgi:hypothetical protein